LPEYTDPLEVTPTFQFKERVFVGRDEQVSSGGMVMVSAVNEREALRVRIFLN